MQEILSRRIRTYFRERATAATLREIDSAWQNEGFIPTLTQGQDNGARRALWRNYEESVDWSDAEHVRRAVKAIESLILHDTDDALRQHRIVLQRDGWTIDEKRRIVKEARDSGLSGLDSLRDPGGILDALARANLLVDANPAGCVGAAKDLLEATAKTVLEGLGSEWSRSDKFPSLISRTQKALGLHVTSVDSARATGGASKHILGGLTSIAIGVDMLRNAEGSGHGRPTAPTLKSRHARLAFNAARTWCEIVLDTYADPDAPWRHALAA